jgi:hypothetical protein
MIMNTYRLLRWSLSALLLGFPLTWESALSQPSSRQQDTKQTGRNTAMAGNDEHELRKLENEWLSVYISGDKATYDRVVADNFTGTDESAVKRSKEQDRALLPAAPAPGGIALNEDVQVRLYGETAVITGRIVTKLKVGDQEVPGFTTRFTDTWLKWSFIPNRRSSSS